MLKLTQPTSAGRDDEREWHDDHAGQFDRRVCDVVSPPVVASHRLPAFMLSAHEVAAMLLLGDTSLETSAATPDIVALRDCGLASVPECIQGNRIVLTPRGLAVLRMLRNAN